MMILVSDVSHLIVVNKVIINHYSVDLFVWFCLIYHNYNDLVFLVNTLVNQISA